MINDLSPDWAQKLRFSVATSATGNQERQTLHHEAPSVSEV